MEIQVIQTGILGVNTLIVPVEQGKCFVVDPAACKLSGDETKIVDFIKSKNLDCVGIVLTHTHFDHITGIKQVKQSFPNALIYVHKSEEAELINPPGPMNRAVLGSFGMSDLLDVVSEQPHCDVTVKDGDIIFEWKVIHTPGHTPGSICLYKSDFVCDAESKKTESVLISGDTLFDYGGYGRTDMLGGDDMKMRQSLAKLYKIIPSGTLVYPGHDSFGFRMAAM